MNNAIIKKDIINYINSNVVISYLNFPRYQKPVYSDEFFNSLTVIIEKLDLLLKKPHQEFWCHIIFEDSVMQFISDYFFFANRPHEIPLSNLAMHKLEIEVHKKFFLVFSRIISKKENLSVFSNLEFGSLIRNYDVFYVSCLFQFCSIYGDENLEIISENIIFLFSCQPKYYKSFQYYALDIMGFLEDEIDLLKDSSIFENLYNYLMRKNNLSVQQKSEGLLNYIIDMFYEWNMFLDAIKDDTEIYSILFRISFHKLLEKSFQKYVPFIQSNIDKFETENREYLKKLLNYSCYYLISVWRKIFCKKFLENFHKKSSKKEEVDCELIRNCLAMITSCQEYPIFADAMYVMFPIMKDIGVILQAVQLLDKDQYCQNFVWDSITDIIGIIDSRKKKFSFKWFIENDLSPQPIPKLRR